MSVAWYGPPDAVAPITDGVRAMADTSVDGSNATWRCAPFWAWNAVWYGSRVCDIRVSAMVPVPTASRVVTAITATCRRRRRRSRIALTATAFIAAPPGSGGG